MKKIVKLILALLVLFIMIIPFSASAQQVSVSVSAFPIVVNGNLVNNQMREYPFILYNNITYFPMTYEDCAFLGVENNWNAESGNVLTKTASSGYYHDYLSPELSLIEHTNIATVASTPITVLGEVINNATQEYPILNYKNVLYFPLTWDWSQKFGWRTNFNTNTFLEVATEDFADAGYYFCYSIDNSKEPKKYEIAKSNVHNILNLYNSEYGYSRNYTGNTHNYTVGTPVPPEGYKFLYKLVAADGMTTNHITVNERLYPVFRQNGWFEVGEEEQAVAEFAKTHSRYELMGAMNALPYISTGNSSIESKIYSIIQNYQTLVSTDLRVCSVKKSDVDVYRNVGWMTESEYVDYFVYLYVKNGDLNGALTFLEKIMDKEPSSDVQLNGIFFLWDYDYEKAENTYYDLTKSVFAKMKKNVEVRGIYPYGSVNKADVIFNCSVPAKKTIKSIEISYDVIDAYGKVVNTVSTTEDIYAVNYLNEKSYMAKNVRCGWNTPAGKSITNVKIKRINIEDTDFRPGGQG